MKCNTPRLLLAAPASGSGKTMLTCALLRALQKRGLSIAGFKCGPDYIDPMFHREILGLDSGNLDLFFATEQLVQFLFGQQAEGKDLAIIEGVMGFYDGLGNTEEASSYQLSKVLAAPTVLVVNCQGLALSLIALVQGFLHYRTDHQIQGIILNQISPALYVQLQSRLAQEVAVPVLGYLPKMEQCRLDSRHLGLITAEEIRDLQQKIDLLAEQLEQTVDLDQLLVIARQAAEVEYQMIEQPTIRSGSSVRIGIARDKAFCFYYADNLRLLEQLGAELVPFSPVADEQLPPELDGLYLGGGYPELYGRQLAANRSLRQQIRQQLSQGMACIAECGGFMYLHQELEDQEGGCWPMVGYISGRTFPGGRLQPFGYVRLHSQQGNCLGSGDEPLVAHEFHYWTSTNCGNSYQAVKTDGKRSWPCVQSNGRQFLGYPHLYFYGSPAIAQQFIQQAAAYRRERHGLV